MLSNSLKMIKIVRNMSELRHIVCKKYSLTLVHMLVLLCKKFVHSDKGPTRPL